MTPPSPEDTDERAFRTPGLANIAATICCFWDMSPRRIPAAAHRTRMKIAFATSEAYPFARPEVLPTYPAHCRRRSRGAAMTFESSCRVIMWWTGTVRPSRRRRAPGRSPGRGEKWAAILESLHIPEVPVYFHRARRLFRRDGLYDEGYTAYTENAERFIFFCNGVMRALKDIDFARHHPL